MFDRVEIEDYKGCSIEIVHDDTGCVDNPLTMCGDPPFEIYCWHGRYTLGTHQPDLTPDALVLQLFYESGKFGDSPDDSLLQFYRHWHKLGFTKNEISALWDEDCDLPFWNREESSAFAGKLVDLLEEEGWLYADIYMYDHSGLVLSVGSGFSCHWDSGQIGFAICRPETLKKEGWNKDHALKYLEGMIENDYTSYLNGEVYGWITKDEDEDEEEIDACWGYYGHREFEHMKAEAKGSINAYLKFKAKEEAEEAERNSYVLKNWEIPTYETTCTPKVVVQ